LEGNEAKPQAWAATVSEPTLAVSRSSPIPYNAPVDDLRDITVLLEEADAGREGALDDLMRLVYDDLERMAASHLRRQFGDRAGQVTLEPAALVNESFMKLIRQRNAYDNRGQFFAIATRVMIRILLDYARARHAEKRGGDRSRVTLCFDDGRLGSEDREHARLIDIEHLDHTLTRLEELDPQMADIVRMRIIWGMEVLEIAQSLGISDSTVKRQWRFAKIWLAKEVGEKDDSLT